MAEHKEDKNINISETLSRTEQYIEANRKKLSIILGAVIVVIAGYLIYKKIYVGGKEKEASGLMFTAERYFRTDSLNRAINGVKDTLGFAEISETYGVSPSGNLAQLYLGISYLRSGKYNEAIEALESYDGDDVMTSSLVLSAIGDAYTELNKTEEAINHYEKASRKEPNNFATPVILMKLGLAYETAGNYAGAVEAYGQIKNDYPESSEGRDITKYIARAKAKVK